MSAGDPETACILLKSELFAVELSANEFALV